MRPVVHRRFLRSKDRYVELEKDSLEENGTDSDIDKSAFGIEVDTDDPQGAFLPLEKLKMMVPGPGVKPRPRLTVAKEVKKKDQSVKRRRKRREATERRIKSSALELPSRPASSKSFKIMYENNGKHARRNKHRYSMLPKIRKLGSEIEMSRIRKDTSMRHKSQLDKDSLAKDKQEIFRSRMPEEKQSTFRHNRQRNDHRSKEWLKKELNSIETLMNATKHRLGKDSSSDNSAISPQLEKDLQKIDQDIHIDLKHASGTKHRGRDEMSGGSHVSQDIGVQSGGNSDNTPFRHHNTHHNVDHSQSRHGNSHRYDGDDDMHSVNVRRDPNRDSNRSGSYHSYGRGSNKEIERHKKMPDISRMLDELEWIRRETDVVRSKAKRIETELRIRQKYMHESGRNSGYFSVGTEDYPDEHNIHLSIRHVERGEDQGRGDYFQRRRDENSYYNNRGRQHKDSNWIEGNQSRKRTNQIQSHETSKLKSNNDKTLQNTFNKLQHDLKILKMKMDARDKLDGVYTYPLEEDRLPKKPPIFDSKYFRSNSDGKERKGNSKNSSPDREDVDEEIDGENEATKVRLDHQQRNIQNEQDVDVESQDLNDDSELGNDDEFHSTPRIKRSLTKRNYSFLAKSLKNNYKNSNEMDYVLNSNEQEGSKKSKMLVKIILLKILKWKEFLVRLLEHLNSNMRGQYRPIRNHEKNVVLGRLMLYWSPCRKLLIVKRPILNRICTNIFKDINKSSTNFGNLIAYFPLHMENKKDEGRRNKSNYTLFTTLHADNGKFDGKKMKEMLNNNTKLSYETDTDIKNTAKHNGPMSSKSKQFLPPEIYVRMKILNNLSINTRNRKNVTKNKNGYANIYSFGTKWPYKIRFRRRSTKSKPVKNTDSTLKEPISKLEKSLAHQFNQLLELLPESKEEKQADVNLYREDLRQEKAFDMGQSVRKVDHDEKADIDFLKESMESNYLLANSRIRRRVLRSERKNELENTQTKKDKQKQHRFKFLESPHGCTKRRSVGATVEGNLTSNTDQNTVIDGDSNAEDGESDIPTMQRDQNIQDKNLLKMMDFYEGKQDDFYSQTERDIDRRKRAAWKSKTKSRHNSWLYPQTRNNPVDARGNYFPEFDPPELDSYFPKAYNDLANARDRLRWYALLDGENKLAHRVEFLNNMADKLIEEETDPILMFLNDMTIPKESDNFKSWAQTHTSDYSDDQDPTILQEAVDDFNRNENERNAAFAYSIRKRRELRSGQIYQNSNRNIDKVSIGTYDRDMENEKSVGTDYDYRFDESQLEELDKDESDDDDDENDDDEVGDEDKEENEQADYRGTDNEYYSNDNNNDDNDEDDDYEIVEEGHKGIEVDDNGKEIEPEEPFAFIEREISTKKKEIRQEEYFWGSWSPCSLTCGIGQRFRSNMCGQGQPCAGKQASTETEICSITLECGL